MLYALRYSLIGCALSLSACIKMLPEEAEPNPKFGLSLAWAPTQGPPVQQTVVVEEPYASLRLNSRQIMVTQSGSPARHTFAADQEWETRLPEMLEKALVKALQEIANIQGVAQSTQSVSADYVILSDLEDFKISYQDGPQNPMVDIGWQVKILKMPERKIIANRHFSVQERAENDRFSEILNAFNAQTSKILSDISGWVRHHLRNEEKQTG